MKDENTGDCNIDLRLLEVDANHRDGDNTIVGDKGVQPFSRQCAEIALGHDIYRDANTILPNNLCEDEFLASVVVVIWDWSVQAQESGDLHTPAATFIMWRNNGQ